MRSKSSRGHAREGSRNEGPDQRNGKGLMGRFGRKTKKKRAGQPAGFPVIVDPDFSVGHMAAVAVTRELSTAWKKIVDEGFDVPQ